MLQEISHYNPVFNYIENKKVLDIGANCGAFTYSALMSGASHITSVEAGKYNYNFLINQPFSYCFNNKIKYINKAVIGDSDKKTIRFYEETRCNTGISGIYPRYNMLACEFYDVETIWFNDLIDYIKPDILKIDVEGSELGYDFTCIPDCTKLIAIELHDDVKKIEEITNYIIKRWQNVLCFNDFGNRREIVAVFYNEH
jgi:FkbM family methyltransferase